MFKRGRKYVLLLSDRDELPVFSTILSSYPYPGDPSALTAPLFLASSFAQALGLPS